jgi:hypothetical protein
VTGHVVGRSPLVVREAGITDSTETTENLDLQLKGFANDERRATNDNSYIQ